ncbi:MAG TPA: CRISPR-associated endoribonuclease Cas6 [Spirochaetota bacterium]|nr:CRISPR-associated endoribonuclease Cas6 [Spirochaetota bacterium]HPR49749.1 CRISPR-associated endoribonuclease Cas6 [Spirochaetota bacterium]
MKIKLTFISDKKIIFPRGYNEYIQAFIYRHLDRAESQWLHDNGFSYEKRRYKLFTFSDIVPRGKYNKVTGTFIYPERISLYVSSPVHWILEQLARNNIISEEIILGKNNLHVESVEIMGNEYIELSPVKVRTLSPIEAHTTFEKEDGKKKTHYYTPFENDFSDQINANIKKKWQSLHETELSDNITIKPLFNGNKYERIRFFGTGENKTVIKAWHGYFELQGTPEVIAFALDAGLGSRNSQGFGMIEVV